MATTRIPGRIQAKASIRPASNPDGLSNISIYVSAGWRPESGVTPGSQFYVKTYGAGVENFYVLGLVISIETMPPYSAAVVKGQAVANGRVVNVEIRLQAGGGFGKPLPYGAFAVKLTGGLTFETPDWPVLKEVYSGQIQITGPK